MRENSGSSESGSNGASRRMRWGFLGLQSAGFDTRERLATLSLFTVLLLAIGTAGGFGCVAWYAISATPSINSAITAFAVALAGFIVGAMLGVLFGLPRTNTQSSPPDSGDTAYRYSRQLFLTNTNLEEVSDWLTKIIVGVGLIQLKDIVGQIEILANFVARNLGGSAEVFALMLIIYFPCLGFMAGYLWARLILLQIVTTVAASRDTDVANDRS